jgi:hypothetical protein
MVIIPCPKNLIPKNPITTVTKATVVKEIPVKPEIQETSEGDWESKRRNRAREIAAMEAVSRAPIRS